MVFNLGIRDHKHEHTWIKQACTTHENTGSSPPEPLAQETVRMEEPPASDPLTSEDEVGKEPALGECPEPQAECVTPARTPGAEG